MGAAGELSGGERLSTLAGATAVLGIQAQQTAGKDTFQCCECGCEFDVDWGEGVIHYVQPD